MFYYYKLSAKWELSHTPYSYPVTIYIYIYSEFSLTVLETSGGFCDIFAVAFFLFNLILFSLQIETICEAFKNKQRLTTNSCQNRNENDEYRLD